MPRRKKKKQHTKPNLGFQSNAPPLLSHPQPSKFIFGKLQTKWQGSLNLLIHKSIMLDDLKILQQFTKL